MSAIDAIRSKVCKLLHLEETAFDDSKYSKASSELDPSRNLDAGALFFSVHQGFITILF